MGITFSKRKKRNKLLGKMANRSANSRGNYFGMGRKNRAFGKLTGKGNMKHR